MINEDSNEKRKSKRISESEIGESKKGGKKSLIEKGEDEVKVRYSLYFIIICSFVKCFLNGVLAGRVAIDKYSEKDSQVMASDGLYPSQ